MFCILGCLVEKSTNINDQLPPVPRDCPPCDGQSYLGPAYVQVWNLRACSIAFDGDEAALGCVLIDDGMGRLTSRANRSRAHIRGAYSDRMIMGKEPGYRRSSRPILSSPSSTMRIGLPRWPRPEVGESWPWVSTVIVIAHESSPRPPGRPDPVRRRERRGFLAAIPSPVPDPSSPRPLSLFLRRAGVRGPACPSPSVGRWWESHPGAADPPRAPPRSSCRLVVFTSLSWALRRFFDESDPEATSRFHIDRTPRRHRDHRGADRPAAAGGPGGARGGPAVAVRQQPQAARPRRPQL